MTTWKDFSRDLIGYPALVGSSGNPAAGLSTVSFGQCVVVALGPNLSACYAKKSTWQETMVASSDALASRSQASCPPGSTDADAGQREGFWRMLKRDFADPLSRRQMAWEREDKVWAEEVGQPRSAALPWNILAARYASATRAGLAAQAGELAKGAKTAADIDAIRKLYYRSREIEDALARWNDAALQSLRLAVEDLSRSFGPRYPRGPELRRCEEGRRSIRPC